MGLWKILGGGGKISMDTDTVASEKVYIIIYDTIDIFVYLVNLLRHCEPWQADETIIIASDGSLYTLGVTDDGFGCTAQIVSAKNAVLFSYCLERLLRESERLPADFEDRSQHELLNIAIRLAPDYRE